MGRSTASAGWTRKHLAVLSHLRRVAQAQSCFLVSLHAGRQLRSLVTASPAHCNHGARAVRGLLADAVGVHVSRVESSPDFQALPQRIECSCLRGWHRSSAFQIRIFLAVVYKQPALGRRVFKPRRGILRTQNMSPMYSHPPATHAQSRPSLSKSQRMLQEEDPRFRSLDRMLARAYIELQRRRAQQQRAGVYMPRMDLYDDPTNTFVTAVFELPGMKPHQLSVRIESGYLVIEGERTGPQMSMTEHQSASSSEPTPQTQTLYPVQEIKYGKFRRGVRLPEGVTASHVRSMLAEGMLTISWPRDPASFVAQTHNPQAAPTTNAVPDAGYEGDDPGTA